MADFNPDDLSREIDRLWARAGSVAADAPTAAAIPSAPSVGATVGAEIAWETVALLKRQQHQSEATWRQAMDAREEALRVLRARLETAETELSRLRSRAEGEDERGLVEALDAHQKIETAQKAAALAEARHAEERRALEQALQSLRERLASETARGRASEQRWQAREQQYLLDLKELQSLAERREKEASAGDKSVRSLEAGMGEAKNALEKTLGELLLERKESERARGEREAALKKVNELRAHVDELSRIWEEERAQWRELWDRERSTWESKRVELAQWEENLRRERETWHAELKAKENAHLALAEDLSGKIRETSLATEKMSDLISTFDRKSADDAARENGAAAKAVEGAQLYAARSRERARLRRRWTFAAAAAAAVLAAAVPAWRAASVWRFETLASSPAPTANPSALALDGGVLWIADWGGRLVAVDAADPRQILRQASPEPGGPYHPTAVAVGGGALWTLDAAQPRLIRESSTAPEKIMAARPSPGPAPAALAFDGEAVWSYDAVDRAVTRHGGDDAPVQSYALPDDAAPDAMSWADGRLWVYDAKGRRLLIYELAKDKLVRVAVQAMPDPNVLGLAVSGTPSDRVVYALLGPSGARAQAAIVRYRIKRLLPVAHF
ncbi:MAG: PQQ-binding-like beta-propeller repeat protein [Elusimicrobia bacterium]|nr:PQQ-binding-like beta-propeller repeat protein [Elusimicrobiota bacterium]